VLVGDGGTVTTDLKVFIGTRPRLFAIAHRIVGNVHEAEDIVQEVWLRWHRVDPATVLNAEAFLVTATARLAINLVQSARHRRETYVAPWLDVPTADGGPPAETERGEAIELAVRLLVERLPPAERAAYLLREGFEYPYQRIAGILRISTANARQLVRRARTRVAAGRCRVRGPMGHIRLARAFAAASLGGEMTGLEAILAADLQRVA
jgi:RNA polymerase sigma factor (sigma-70 family)